MKNIREILIRAIRRSGMTDYALGKAARIAPNNLLGWRKDPTKRLREDTIDRLCEVLDLELRPVKRIRRRK